GGRAWHVSWSADAFVESTGIRFIDAGAFATLEPDLVAVGLPDVGAAFQSAGLDEDLIRVEVADRLADIRITGPGGRVVADGLGARARVLRHADGEWSIAIDPGAGNAVDVGLAGGEEGLEPERDRPACASIALRLLDLRESCRLAPAVPGRARLP